MALFDFIRTIKEARKFKPNPHITVSGNGVISTTSAHYMASSKVKKQSQAIGIWLSKNNQNIKIIEKIKMEKLIIKLDLPMIESFRVLEFLVAEGYQQTGNKFSVEFNGSKGYMNHITISCEGAQTEDNNIIPVAELMTEAGRLKKKTVSIFHSHENGVRIAI